MTVDELIKKLKEESKFGHGHLEVFMFAHDHDPREHPEEGVGPVLFIRAEISYEGKEFLTLKG